MEITAMPSTNALSLFLSLCPAAPLWHLLDLFQDGNGTIDKDELRQLFVDVFPSFHRNMLERYVTDEFNAADTDFSAG